MGAIPDSCQPHPLIVADRIVMLGRRQAADVVLDLVGKVKKVQDLSDSGRIESEGFGEGEAGQTGCRVQLLFDLKGSLEEPLDRRRAGRLVATLTFFDRLRLLGTQNPFLSAGSICAAKSGFVQEQHWALQPGFSLKYLL